MANHYDIPTGSPPSFDHYDDVTHEGTASARPRLPTTASDNYYDVAGYNVNNDGGYYDTALPNNLTELPRHKIRGVLMRLSKELRMGLMNQLQLGLIKDNGHAVVPDYETQRHVSIRGGYIRKELMENYYEEIKDIIGPTEPNMGARNQRNGRALQPRQTMPNPSNGQPRGQSPRPPPRQPGASVQVVAPPATPTSGHQEIVPLPLRTPPRQSAWYKRMWDWIYTNPMISLPLTAGILFLFIVVLVIVLVVSLKGESTTTTSLPLTTTPAGGG